MFKSKKLQNKELPPNSYQYYIPAANFSAEALDDNVKDREVVSADSFDFDASTLSSAGTAGQTVVAGFEVNPYDDTANDRLGFLFELDAPDDALKEAKTAEHAKGFQKHEEHLQGLPYPVVPGVLHFNNDSCQHAATKPLNEGVFSLDIIDAAFTIETSLKKKAAKSLFSCASEKSIQVDFLEKSKKLFPKKITVTRRGNCSLLLTLPSCSVKLRIAA